MKNTSSSNHHDYFIQWFNAISQPREAKINKWYNIKSLLYCKRNNEQSKKILQNLREYICLYSFDKGLISKKYKALYKCFTRKKIFYYKCERGKDEEKLPQKRNRYSQKAYEKNVFIIHCQRTIKITMRYHFIPVWLTQITKMKAYYINMKME